MLVRSWGMMCVYWAPQVRKTTRLDGQLAGVVLQRLEW